MDRTFAYLIIFIIFIEGAAQYFLQRHVDMKEIHYLVVGLVLYGLVAYVYYHILRRGQKIAVATTLWAVGSMVVGSFTGWFLFNQPFTKRMFLGMVLVFSGGYLMM